MLIPFNRGIPGIGMPSVFWLARNIMRKTSIALAVVFASAASLVRGASVTPASELQELRDELAQLRKSYEERISALEARVAQAEAVARNAQGKVTAASSAESGVLERAYNAPVSVAAAVTNTNNSSGPSTAPTSEAAFNPALSLVLGGTYTRFSQDPNRYAINGFIPSGNDVGPPKRSFGLGESELGITADIDQILRGQFTVSIPANGNPDVEEAFIQTLALDHGLTLKAGRFLSGIGYLNGQHSHVWDFTDAPLAYSALLGGQRGNDGIQAKWIAPADLLIELGGEMGSGVSFPATDRNKNGNTAGALFAHIGGDAGDSGSWRMGLSVFGTSPHDRQYDDVDSVGNAVTNSFTGKSRIWIADVVWKQDFMYERKLIVQSEYFRRRENGTLAFDINGANQAGDYRVTQSGFYAQAVYQFLPDWRIGYRYDWLDSSQLNLGDMLDPENLPVLAAYKPRRNTLMLDFSASEFSRLRLQFARDQSRRNMPDNQVWLQYIVSLGAHGAHRY
jgi:hypothetical protein